ncbi:ABC transporter substrate-binding protein [Nocardiopsis oceani]
MPTTKALPLPLTAATLTLVLTLTACGDDGNGPDIGNGDNGAFTYGILYPQTGNLASLGPPQLAATEYAISEINEAGGILGSEVPDPVQADETADPGQANEAANNLVAEDVNAVIGAAASAMTQATYASITGSQIVQCSGSNTAPDLTEIDDDGYYFRTAPSDLLAGPVLAQQIIEDGHDSVAVIARADDYGSGYLTAVETELASLGVDVVMTESYDPDATNYGAVIDAIIEAQADAIALISFEEGGELMATLLESGHVDGDQFYLTDGLNDPDLDQTIGADGPEAINGTTGVAPSADNPEFNDGLREFSPDLEIFQYAPHVFDCVTAIALAAESAGSAEPSEYVGHLAEISRPAGTECHSFQECRDLLNEDEDIDYQGVSGDIDLDDNGDPTSATFELFHFGDDGYDTLGFEDYSTDD